MSKQSPLLSIRPIDGRDHKDGLAQAIADEIGRAIAEWRLQPGDELSSLALAKRFRTSRTPIREALVKLEQDGLVEVPPRRRARVAVISLDEVRGIYEVRAALNALLGELLARAPTAELIAGLRERLEAMRHALESDDVDAYLWANVDFHRYAAESCGNRMLHRLTTSIGYRVLQFRRLSLSRPHRLQQSYHDHVRLVEAIEQRDQVLAAALWRNIMLAGIAAIEESGWADTRAPAAKGAA